MNATTQDNKIHRITDIKAFFDRLRDNPRIIFLITAAAAISIVIALLFWMREPDYRILYSNISEQDGGAIVTQLTQMQVPYRFAGQSGAIMIPEDRVYEVRLKLAQLGLPKGGTVGFELMDQERFGISQFNEQVNYQRALEGELARTIETLGPVQRARVHLAIPKPSLFIREQKAPTASVTLQLQNNRLLDAGQVSAVSYLIASAVPGLNADNITIVDQAGHLLTQKGAQATQTSQLKYTRDVEADYQSRIQAILAPVVGSQNVRTQVTAQMDFTRNEQTVEQFAPNTSADQMSVRSRHTSQSEQGGGKGTGGVPGALSNQPPIASSAPITTAAKSVKAPAHSTVVASPTASVAARTTSSFDRHQEDTTNYELDHTLKHITRNAGTVERLSVAVVINYLPDKSGNAAELPAERLAQIDGLVKEAIGYSVTRGDSVNIVNAPFSMADKAVAIPLWKQPEFTHLLLTLARYLFVAVIAWVLWRRAVLPFWLKHQELMLQRLTMEKEAREAEQADLRLKKEHSEKAKAQQRLDIELNTQHLRSMADQTPQVIALVIRQWMNKEQKSS